MICIKEKTDFMPMMMNTKCLKITLQ